MFYSFGGLLEKTYGFVFFTALKGMPTLSKQLGRWRFSPHFIVFSFPLKAGSFRTGK